MSFVTTRATRTEASADFGEQYLPGEGYLITGVMAAGKSTIAQLLAQQLVRGVHLRGDVFRKMIVTDRDPITPPLGPEAQRQLDLRQRLAAATANDYWRDGFNVVLQDLYVGDALSNVIGRLEITPLYVFVLNPRSDVVAQRESGRSKTGYGQWNVDTLWTDFNEETPHVGLWLDTSQMTPEETVATIVARKYDARVR
jgi:chloramphenicol 3-O-phosphotransferase